MFFHGQEKANSFGPMVRHCSRRRLFWRWVKQIQTSVNSVNQSDVVKLAPVGMNVFLFCVYTLQSETDDLCRRSRPPVSMCHSYSLFSLPQATCQGSLKHGKLVDGFVFDDSLLHVEGMAALTKHIVSNCLNRCRDQLFVSPELLNLLKIMKPISMLYVQVKYLHKFHAFPKPFIRSLVDSLNCSHVISCLNGSHQHSSSFPRCRL